MQDIDVSISIHKHMLSPKFRQDLKAELLPKIKTIKSTKLLSRVQRNPNRSAALALPMLSPTANR